MGKTVITYTHKTICTEHCYFSTSRGRAILHRCMSMPLVAQIWRS